MDIIIGLIVAALFLFFAEIFFPGVVLFLFGLLLLIAASIIAAVKYGASGGMLTFAASVMLATIMLFVEIYIIKNSRWGKIFHHTTSNQAVSNSPPGTPDIVGKYGTVLSPMVPSGLVTIEGKNYQAYSRSGHLQKGVRIKVVGRDAFKLIVEAV